MCVDTLQAPPNLRAAATALADAVRTYGVSHGVPFAVTAGLLARFGAPRPRLTHALLARPAWREDVARQLDHTVHLDYRAGLLFVDGEGESCLGCGHLLPHKGEGCPKCGLPF